MPNPNHFQDFHDTNDLKNYHGKSLVSDDYDVLISLEQEIDKFRFRLRKFRLKFLEEGKEEIDQENKTIKKSRIPT